MLISFCTHPNSRTIKIYINYCVYYIKGIYDKMDLKTLTIDEVHQLIDDCKAELLNREKANYVEIAKENGFVLSPHRLPELDDNIAFKYKFISFTVPNNQRLCDSNYLVRYTGPEKLENHKAFKSRSAVKGMAIDYLFHVYYWTLNPGYGLVYDLWGLEPSIVICKGDVAYVYVLINEFEGTGTSLSDDIVNGELPKCISYNGKLYMLDREEDIDSVKGFDIDVIPLDYNYYE